MRQARRKVPARRLCIAAALRPAAPPGLPGVRCASRGQRRSARSHGRATLRADTCGQLPPSTAALVRQPRSRVRPRLSRRRPHRLGVAMGAVLCGARARASRRPACPTAALAGCDPVAPATSNEARTSMTTCRRAARISELDRASATMGPPPALPAGQRKRRCERQHGGRAATQPGRSRAGYSALMPRPVLAALAALAIIGCRPRAAGRARPTPQLRSRASSTTHARSLARPCRQDARCRTARGLSSLRRLEHAARDPDLPRATHSDDLYAPRSCSPTGGHRPRRRAARVAGRAHRAPEPVAGDAVFGRSVGDAGPVVVRFARRSRTRRGIHDAGAQCAASTAYAARGVDCAVPRGRRLGYARRTPPTGSVLARHPARPRPCGPPARRRLTAWRASARTRFAWASGAPGRRRARRAPPRLVDDAGGSTPGRRVGATDRAGGPIRSTPRCSRPSATRAIFSSVCSSRCRSTTPHPPRPRWSGSARSWRRDQLIKAPPTCSGAPCARRPTAAAGSACGRRARASAPVRSGPRAGGDRPARSARPARPGPRTAARPSAAAAVTAPSSTSQARSATTRGRTRRFGLVKRRDLGRTRQPARGPDRPAQHGQTMTLSARRPTALLERGGDLLGQPRRRPVTLRRRASSPQRPRVDRWRSRVVLLADEAVRQ